MILSDMQTTFTASLDNCDLLMNFYKLMKISLYLTPTILNNGFRNVKKAH